MSPIDLGNMAQYLGPGTGGLWMGEQQRNAMQESELGQKKTLEDILTAQQNRDIAAQKAPLERAQMEAQTGLMGAQAGELKGKEEERQRKIKKESYQEFIDGLTQMQDLGGLGEQAGYLNDLSKRTGIPQDHPMFEVALKMRAQGGPAWDNFVKSMKVSPETRFKEEQQTIRAASHAASAREVATIGADSRTEVAQIRAAQAQTKAQQIKQSTDQLKAAYIAELATTTDPARRAALQQYIKFIQDSQVNLAQSVGAGKTEETVRLMEALQNNLAQLPPPKQAPTAPATAVPPATSAPAAATPAAPAGQPPGTVQNVATGQPAAAPKAPPPGQVRVKAPNGSIGFIPESQLQEALSSGYTKL